LRFPDIELIRKMLCSRRILLAKFVLSFGFYVAMGSSMRARYIGRGIKNPRLVAEELGGCIFCSAQIVARVNIEVK
jgi:hypothetical protein